MEDEAPCRRSVAELAGRFKSSAAQHNAAGNEADKPVRRRPPRSLHIAKPQGDEQEPPSVTSPQPKAKRNSGLIEKLQANLALSPTTMLPSPKSPGFKLLPPNFSPLSPSSTPLNTSSTAAPTSPVTASPVTEEEGPVSFEDPLREGSILSSVNKGRVRHSLRRRPPSRRHRKSSTGDEVGVVNDVPDSPTTGEGGEVGGGEGGVKEGGAEVLEKEGKTEEVEEKTETSTCPEKNEEESKMEPKEEEGKKEEGENGPTGGEEEGSSSGVKQEEEEKSGEKQNDVSTEGATNTETKEEESKETTSESSAR